MLAIIIVNYDDNLWNDQNLETDLNLPPGWRTIRDTTGTYYWHVPTGTTQWQHPSYSSATGLNLSTREGILQEMPSAISEESKERLYSSPGTSLSRRNSLPWPDEELFQSNNEPGSKCFAVRSLGWVEIPEEDLAPGKSSITVNNCIQQLSHSKCDSRDPAGASGEGQKMVMILKKDTMSLVDPLDHSVIHCQPVINIRVWGVGCNNGRDRDFAFVANDKDTCMLKCHVFRCDVPAKAIGSALHEMCSKIVAERATTSSSVTQSVTLESISPEDLPLQVDILDAVRQSIQKYEALYVGSLPVSKPMGMDVLNETIESLINSTDREYWKPALIDVSDTTVSVHQSQAAAGGDEDTLWECQVRYVTFIGVGKDPHTFALIVDVGTQSFQCYVFWCEPNAGTVSEAVQAACMVQYQKCLVATTSQMKTKTGAHSKSLLKMKRTSAVDSPLSSFPSSGHPLQKGTGATRRRGVRAFFESLKQKQSIVQTP
ncbi:amyloid-beta A4 precursor protein-binding family B member 3 [Microcaecilia unicolor]|uniref:Amyloid-beta A4 precursor protein-binding family B member 3 n=1 Tax=Microcaecilia unicolor TaxID=1415580 RepID=A0A6P7YUY3_9AMPH|nr:amyloid-beta A4 precursor protein-binding family B member 3 [Microcaecilia unicolor]